MATAEKKVRALYPNAAGVRYKTAGPFGEIYYLIWSDGYERGKRLGEGKTKAAAYAHAASRLPKE